MTFFLVSLFDRYTATHVLFVSKFSLSTVIVMAKDQVTFASLYQDYIISLLRMQIPIYHQQMFNDLHT